MKHIVKNNLIVEGDSFIGSKSIESIHSCDANRNLESQKGLSARFTSFHINPILSKAFDNKNKHSLTGSSPNTIFDDEVRAIHKLSKGDMAQDSMKELDKELSYVFIKTGNKLVKVVMESILYIYTDSKNYCSLATADNKKVSVRSSIQKLYKLLDNDIFVRTHRSYLINWKMVDTIFESDQTVEINGHHIPIGRTYKKDVYAKLNIL